MRIGTRASALALAQARLVGAALLERAAIDSFELVPLVTSGDRGLAREDKSRWVSELEDALHVGRIELAVHSAKDVPARLREGLALLGAPARAAAEDVLCGARDLDVLAQGARVGTSSLRRAAQLRAAREDLEIVSLRGNVDTRLAKLASSDGARLDAIVLARAALQRLGREGEIGAELDPERFVPAPGQGTLALQGRADDEQTSAAVASISDESTLSCLLAERALARALEASCNTPLGAHALEEDGALRLRAWVGLPDGSAWLLDERVGERAGAEALGAEVAQRLLRAGAAEILAQAERLAAAPA
jgi:hydroxymethylbilane synthase